MMCHGRRWFESNRSEMKTPIDPSKMTILQWEILKGYRDPSTEQTEQTNQTNQRKKRKQMGYDDREKPIKIKTMCTDCQFHEKKTEWMSTSSGNPFMIGPIGRDVEVLECSAHKDGYGKNLRANQIRGAKQECETFKEVARENKEGENKEDKSVADLDLTLLTPP